MIAFGACIASRARFVAFAQHGIARCAEPGAVVLERASARSMCSAYNEMLDEAARLPGLECLVMIHEDTEIQDVDLAPKLRRLLADHSIGVVGVIGARNITSLEWWEGDMRGRVHEESRVLDFGDGTVDVEAVDGLFMAISPWAVREVRFDERTFRGFHGYDVDYCFEVRRRTRRVMVTPVEILHHARGGIRNGIDYERAKLRWQAKWGFTSPAAVGARSALVPLRLKKRDLLERVRTARRESRSR